MQVMSTSNRDAPQSDDRDAQTFASTWMRTGAELEAVRLRELRALTELDAARRFARLLWKPTGEALRPESGLVEQQRIFARLRASLE
jgi:hypothetical protein